MIVRCLNKNFCGFDHRVEFIDGVAVTDDAQAIEFFRSVPSIFTLEEDKPAEEKTSKKKLFSI